MNDRSDFADPPLGKAFPIALSFQTTASRADVKRVGMVHARWEACRVTRELNVLALIKGDERYIFVYDDGSREELINDIRDKATDPAVAISWFDAAVLTERVRTAVATPLEEF